MPIALLSELATTSADSKPVDAIKLVEHGNGTVEVDIFGNGIVGNAHNNGKSESDTNGRFTSETIFCACGSFVLCVGVVVCVGVVLVVRVVVCVGVVLVVRVVVGVW